MLFPCQQEAAFGNLAFWQPFGSVLVVGLGIPQSVCAYHVIPVVMGILTLATCLYILLELRMRRERRRKKRDQAAATKEERDTALVTKSTVHAGSEMAEL